MYDYASISHDLTPSAQKVMKFDSFHVIAAHLDVILCFFLP